MKRMYPTLFAAILLVAGCHGDGNDPSNVSNAPITEISLPEAGPFGVAISPDGKYALVSMFGDYGTAGPGNTVAVIDARTDSLVKTLTVGLRPQDIAFTEDGSRAYIVNGDSATLSVIDLGTLTVTGSISIGMAAYESSPGWWSGMFPYGITIHEGQAYIFSAGNSDGSDENITIVDVTPSSGTYHQKTGGIEKSGSFSRGVIRPGTTELVVPRGSAGNNWQATPELAIFDTSSDTYVTSIPVHPADGEVHGMEDIAITPNGKYAYVSFYSWGSTLTSFEVFVVDLETRLVRDILTLNNGDNSTHGVALSPDGLLAGITSWNTGKVSWIFTPTNTVVREDMVGENPNEIAISANGTKAYITNQNSQNISVISLPSTSQLLVDMVDSATMTQTASDDLAWRVSGLQNAVASGNEQVTQVWIDDLAIKIRFWSDQGAFSAGQTKSLTAAGAANNSVAEPLSQGGIHANLQ